YTSQKDKPKMVKIFVGNVNSSTTEQELRELFEKYGAVSDCDILKNYGFVHMEEEEAAQKAVAALHKHELNGSRITVEYATTKVRNATKIYVGNVPEGATHQRYSLGSGFDKDDYFDDKYSNGFSRGY
ncbi:hypothetical protein Z043_113650, partial [Scleropages formosus]